MAQSNRAVPAETDSLNIKKKNNLRWKGERKRTLPELNRDEKKKRVNRGEGTRGRLGAET